MNLFLKIAASLPILIYFIIIRPTVQQESWDSEPEEGMDLSRFLNTMLMGMGDKIKKPFDISNLDLPKINFTKPSDSGSSGNKPDVGPSAYNFLTSFVNQTRSTIPLIARHGNFTLIQAALLFTIGCMAAGAATIVLEGLAFRERETEIELYKRLKDQHGHPHGAYGPPPPPSSMYGVSTYGQSQDSYSSAHSEPIPSYVSPPDTSYLYSSANSNSDPFASYYATSSRSGSRKKRDTGQLEQLTDGSFLQLSKPYHHRRNHYNRPGNGFYPRFPQNGGGGGLPGDRLSTSFAGGVAGSNYNGIGLVGSSSSQQLTGYPAPNNYLMLNRLGMKKKHYGSQKRRIQNAGGDDNVDDDDEMEYARGITIGGENQEAQPRRVIRKRKHRKSQNEPEVDGHNLWGGDDIFFNVPQRLRMRTYWKNLERKR